MKTLCTTQKLPVLFTLLVILSACDSGTQVTLKDGAITAPPTTTYAPPSVKDASRKLPPCPPADPATTKTATTTGVSTSTATSDEDTLVDTASDTATSPLLMKPCTKADTQKPADPLAGANDKTSGTGTGTKTDTNTTVATDSENVGKTDNEKKILKDAALKKGDASLKTEDGTIYTELKLLQKKKNVSCPGIRAEQIRWDEPKSEVTKDYAGKFFADVTCVSNVSSANGNNDFYRQSFRGEIDKNTGELKWISEEDVAPTLLKTTTPDAKSGT